MFGLLLQLRGEIAASHSSASGKYQTRWKNSKEGWKGRKGETELEMLKKELQQLVAAEEYEKAALTRDRIREMEKANEKAKDAGETTEKEMGGDQ